MILVTNDDGYNAAGIKQLYKNASMVDDAVMVAASYHIINGHVSMWLNYMGFPELAENLKTARSPEEAIRILKSSQRWKTRSTGNAGKNQRRNMKQKMV